MTERWPKAPSHPEPLVGQLWEDAIYVVNTIEDAPDKETRLKYGTDMRQILTDLVGMIPKRRTRKLKNDLQP